MHAFEHKVFATITFLLIIITNEFYFHFAKIYFWPAYLMILMGAAIPDFDNDFGTRYHRSFITHGPYLFGALGIGYYFLPVPSEISALIAFFMIGYSTHMLLDLFPSGKSFFVAVFSALAYASAPGDIRGIPERFERAWLFTSGVLSAGFGVLFLIPSYIQETGITPTVEIGGHAVLLSQVLFGIFGVLSVFLMISGVIIRHNEARANELSKVKGITKETARKLVRAGAYDIKILASMDDDFLAAAAGISKKDAARYIRAAKRYFEKIEEFEKLGADKILAEELVKAGIDTPKELSKSDPTELSVKIYGVADKSRIKKLEKLIENAKNVVEE